MTLRTLAASIAQATWGLPQTAIGAAIAYACTLRGRRRRRYRTALVTLWHLDRGLSLGPFVFIPARYPAKGTRRLIAHEYGHTLQSLILGPLYLPLIMLPSLVWAGLPSLERRRQRQHISYYAFYPERWANHFAHTVTGDTPEGYLEQ